MKVQKLVGNLIVVAALSASVTMVHAQNFDLFAVGSRTSFFDNHTNTYGYGYTSYRPGASVAIGTEFHLNRILGVEGSYAVGRNNFSDVGSTTETIGIRTQRVSGDMVVHLPKLLWGVKPYGATGIEFDRFSPIGTVAEASFLQASFLSGTAFSQNKVGFNYGGGIDKKLMGRLALRLEVRDHITSSPTYGLSDFQISRLAQRLDYSAGVVYHFGK